MPAAWSAYEYQPSFILGFHGCDKKTGEGKITEPFVLGAIIDLRHCLDLFDGEGLQQVKEAHSELGRTFKLVGEPLPKNVGRTPDKAGRSLDCAVLNFLHKYREVRGEDAYDSVRGPFLERHQTVSAGGVSQPESHPALRAQYRLHQGVFQTVDGLMGSVTREVPVETDEMEALMRG
jgi:hypothetical protein